MRSHLEPSPALLAARDRGPLVRSLAVTVAGLALYGFTVGFWRSPVMGFYVAAKLPLLVLLTLGCNGFLNGLLGGLLGSGLGFRQSAQALLSAFAVAALVLASLAPVTFFLALNAPAPDAPGAATAHASFLLSHTLLIAVAGVIGVLRLKSLMRSHCRSHRIAHQTLLAWIAGNAFIGAQFSWILRPFFGSPRLRVAFLRDDPLQGNFYEAVWNALRLLLPEGSIPVLAVVLALTTGLGMLLHAQRKPLPS